VSLRRSEGPTQQRLDRPRGFMPGVHRSRASSRPSPR
jgi:hypothetical protein